MTDVVPHLIYNCEDQLKVLGRSRGSSYVRRQLAHWRSHYGDITADRVAASLSGKYDLTPQPETPMQPIPRPRQIRRQR
jgi:hypothetical protein